MNEITSVRGRYNSSVGRDTVKFIINRQLKIKAPCCRIVSGSRLCAFGLHSSEKDFEISLMISNGLPSVKMPLRFEYKPGWKSEHLFFKLITFPLRCLVSLAARSSSFLQVLPWRTTLKKGNTRGQGSLPVRPFLTNSPLWVPAASFD